MTDEESLFRAPRLTRLEIQGFKSFLNRTIFAFEPGITTIVGPNGSGKSNVADAVRWVLGEQGQSALRARKTEDVIFSGGQGRAPAGMAEATLTFDNSDGWLPTEFSEVSVTRRAFRSGENHYLINGRRVRLKDVALLTAGLGQSHVVVGQGLVDAALSLRAEDRRGLFEHAADLTGLRLKVAEAERNLAETDSNTTRLNDLLLELEPRLKTLERAARQAKEWQGLRDRLRDLQGAHYRAELEDLTTALEDARRAAESAEAAASSAIADEANLAAERERSDERLATARERMAQHDAQRAMVGERLRRQTHERDLAAARLEALSRRRADMDDAREGLDERVASVAAELNRLTADLRVLERITAECREATTRYQNELAAQRAIRAELEKRLATAERDLAEGERKAAELARRHAVLGERAASQLAERDRLTATIDERERRITALERDRAEAEAASAEELKRNAELDREGAALSAALHDVSQRAATERAANDRAQRSLAEAVTRLEVLRRMLETGAGLHGGVKEVLAAARSGRLKGVLGTVAELLVVPEALEVAIEVVLGSRLQDIVVERWSEAEAAIAHLRHTGAGRATFQPLDTVRGGRAAIAPQDAQNLAGYRGVAASLVTAPANIASVVAALLGRTLVVDDLETARTAVSHLAPGWSVVTTSGEIARAGGSLTGGAAVRESGTLGRERELRELPATIAGLEEHLRDAGERVAALDAEMGRLQESQRQTEGQRATLRASADERRQQRARLEGWIAELSEEQARSERRRDELTADEQHLASALEVLEQERGELGIARQEATRQRDESSFELEALNVSATASERVAADEGRRLAGLEERLRGERRREAGLLSQERALAEELALRAERTAMVDREREALRAEQARLLGEVQASTGELASLANGLAPLRDAAAAAEKAAGAVANALQQARLALVEQEREQDHAGFNLERATQEWQSLRRRIVEELEFADPEEVLTWESAAASIPVAQREAEIGRLRERLRRVGYVGEDAVADYERESTQQAYLREQRADVEGAATALRALLADLRQTMRARFEETFAKVAEAFAQAFATLFGGGTAKLVLTEGDHGQEPGIEIIAQPPGKRLQNLALLSGGERALTAAALLFAILKVNPVPFCLLDEVDAALDEANVVRFRERLQALARQTQIIVVTHNRGTIEIADTLYGVSMGADGVSQVLSLRLTESLSAD